MFQAIAAMSENRVIGAGGKIPWHIPEDFRWFKHKTMGGTLIMGRKTFESIGRALPGRKTVVVTRGEFTAPGIEIVQDLQGYVRDAASNATRPAAHGSSNGTQALNGARWVCGGADIYRQLLPECQLIYLTQVKHKMDGDTFMPMFESSFELQQVIHDTPEFRVERWRQRGLSDLELPDEWPFR
jgi:dihydrofolate reductase